MVYIITLTALNTRVNGKMTSSTVRATRHGLTAANFMGFMWTHVRRARACTYGPMATSISVNGKTMPFPAMGYTLGTMAEFMSVSGKIMLCTERELISGLMVGCIMVAIRMIRKMVSVSTSGSMGEPTSETGLKESKPVREFTFFRMAQ